MHLFQMKCLIHFLLNAAIFIEAMASNSAKKRNLNHFSNKSTDKLTPSTLNNSFENKQNPISIISYDYFIMFNV